MSPTSSDALAIVAFEEIMEGEIADVREILSNGVISPRWCLVVDVLKHGGTAREKFLSA